MRPFLWICGFLLLFSPTLNAQWQRLPNSPSSTDIAAAGGKLFIIVNSIAFESSDQGITWNSPLDSVNTYRLIELHNMIFGLSGNGDYIWRWNTGKWDRFKSLVDDDITAIHDTLFGSRWG